MRTTVGRIGSTSRPGLPCHLWNTYYTCNIMWHTMDSSWLFIRASCFLGQSRGSPKARNGVLCARSCLEQKWDWYADSTSFQQACVFRHSDIHLLESQCKVRALPWKGPGDTWKSVSMLIARSRKTVSRHSSQRYIGQIINDLDVWLLVFKNTKPTPSIGDWLNILPYTLPVKV